MLVCWRNSGVCFILSKCSFWGCHLVNILNWCYFNPPVPPDLKSVGLLFFSALIFLLYWLQRSVVGERAGLGNWSSWKNTWWKKSLIFTWGSFFCRAAQILLPQQERSGVRMRMSSSGWGKDWICLVVVLSGWFGWFACTHLYICIFFRTVAVQKRD